MSDGPDDALAAALLSLAESIERNAGSESESAPPRQRVRNRYRHYLGFIGQKRDEE